MRKRKPRSDLPFKLISFVVIIFFAAALLLGGMLRFFRTSDYFKIEDIIIRGNDNVDLSYLKGKNMFSIDLHREAEHIRESFPDCSRVKLIRLLPNRLFVDFIKRKPVAYIKLYRYFALASDGVIFYPTESPEQSQLPVVWGLETKIFGPKAGKKYNNKEIQLSLDIIGDINTNRHFRNFRLKKIKITSPEDISLFFVLPADESGLLEARLSGEQAGKKIDVLGRLLIHERDNLDKIIYIDLRFKEPLMKYKDNVKS